MKKFLLKNCLFVAIVFLFSAVFLLIGKYLLNKPAYLQIDKSVKIAVFGNSHSECAFNDSIINNFANFSSSGETYFYTYLKLKKILSNNKHLNTILLEYTNNQIDIEMEGWTFDNKHLNLQIPTYYPYLEANDFGFLMKNNLKGFIKISPKIYIRETALSIINSCSTKKNIEKNKRFGGFKYLIRNKTDSILKNLPAKKTYYKPQFSKNNLFYLEKIKNFCANYKIKLILVRSPLHNNYQGFYNELAFQDILKTKLKNLPFLDFRNFSKNNEDFGDLEHLNHTGAKKFSTFFNNLIQNKILTDTKNQELTNYSITVN